MTRRLIKRNAHVCMTIAAFWLLFSFFAVLDWRDVHRNWGDLNAVVDYGIWGIQFLLIYLTAYFHRTETPREVLWLGETKGYASGLLYVDEASSIFKRLALLVPELTDTENERLVMLAREADAQGETSLTIPITFRHRQEQFTVSFEKCENRILELLISTHPDLADEIDDVLALPQSMGDEHR